MKTVILAFVFAAAAFCQCGPNATLKPIGGGKQSCVPKSTLIGTDASGNVANGASCPGGATNSVCVGGAYYGDGSHLSGIAAGAPIVLSISGGGNPIVTGVKGYYVVPTACTISSWNVVADQTGSIVIDIWKAANAVPTIANTITASALPTLTSAQLATNGAITGWTTAVSAGDVLGFNVNSATTVTSATLTVKCQ